MSDEPPVLDSDLDAYIDNQLDAAGRLRVEMWLARHPETAARVMEDIGLQTTLRLALAEAAPFARPETREAARRLASGLAGQRMWQAVRRVAAVAGLFAAGWFANATVHPFGAREVVASVHPPSFVEQAVQAHQTSLVRETMPSQPETRLLDRSDIRAATAIGLPELPGDWTVTDVQVFPSPFGPSVEMGIKTPQSGRLSLFAVRPGYFAVEPVTHLALSNATVAWWQIGEVAYAIVSSTPDAGLDDKAGRLMKSLH